MRSGRLLQNWKKMSKHHTWIRIQIKRCKTFINLHYAE